MRRKRADDLRRDCGTTLIVDPDAESRSVLVGLLARASFECVEVATGNEAIATARAERPWLVVLEVRLPDVGGYEVCRELRDEFGEEVAIVFISADRTDPFDRATGLLVGGDDYIVKPFDPGEFLARVRRLSARSNRVAPRSDPTQAGLTRREREVLTLLALGRRPREIAAELGINVKTVSSHLQRVLGKLSVNSRGAGGRPSRTGMSLIDTPTPDVAGVSV